MKQPLLMIGTGLALSSMVLPAEAHVGVHVEQGFLTGLTHPFTGSDHVLSMLGVGFWSHHIQGHYRLSLGTVFLVMMAIGAGLGFSQVALPMAEPIIAALLLVMACAFAARHSMPALSACLLVAAMAVFHGYVHAGEIASNTSVLAYSLGFLSGTAILLHAGGLTARVGTACPALLRGAYAFLCAATGMALLAGV